MRRAPVRLLPRLVLALALLLGGLLPGRARAQEALPDDDVELVLCFSGGGTRAAAFALGAARGLAELEAGGAPLLERVDRVVGVSGGSLTAAQVALDRSPEALARFEEQVLRADLERAMVKAAAASPVALTFRALTRGDVAAECFAERLGATTFATLPARPELWIQTTDVVGQRPLVLSRASLAHLGLPPDELPLARAVAASAAFPGIFPPLALPAPGHHPRDCPGAEGCVAAVGSPASLFLADGGILDNLGLEPALAEPPPPGTRSLVVVVVNARCGLETDPATLTSSWRIGLHTVAMQQRRIDELLLAHARDQLRLRELEAAARGEHLRARLVVIDFTGSERQAELDRIGTRFALDEDEITLLLEEGRAVARARAAELAAAWAVPP